MEFKEIQKLVEESYIRNGFRDEFNLMVLENFMSTLPIDKIIEITDVMVKSNMHIIGDIAEVGLFGEEVGELLDAIRKDGDRGVECADLVIRVMNFCNRKGIDLEHEILKKNEKNMKRKYLHEKRA